MKCECSACGSIFDGFSKPISFRKCWPEDLPDSPGVYLICVRKRGAAPEAALRSLSKLRKSWKMYAKYCEDYLKLLKRISDCPVLYIGRAGGPGSRNTVSGRYGQLRGGHVKEVPLSALARLGWEMEIRYRKCQRTETPQMERRYLKEYERAHEDKPALNVRMPRGE